MTTPNFFAKVAAAIAVFAVLAWTPTARAQIYLYQTSFTSPTYVDGPLNTNTDTTTPGQDGWLNTNGGGTNNITVSNAATNGQVGLTTSGQDVRRPFDGGQVVNSGSVFLRANVTVSAASTGDYALHFADTTSLFYARTYFQASGAGFVLALGTSSGTGVTYGTTVLPFGTPVNLLMRYDFVPGAGNDTGALYVNPTTVDGSGDTPYVAATTIGTDATQITSVALRQGSAASAATLIVDNYAAFTMTPIPEPSTLALAGIGAVGLIARWRKRRSVATA